MQPNPRSRLLGVTGVLAIVLAACTGSGPSGSAATGSPGEASASAVTDPSGTPRAIETSPATDAWLAVGREGRAGLEVILAGTTEHLFDLPVGVPDETWGRLVTAEASGDATIVREVAVANDLQTSSRTVAGRWRLPTIGDDALPVGVSRDGSTVVLVEDVTPATGATTRFAVLRANAPTQILELPGSLEFDALSPDGSILYVVEHLPAPPDAHYQVRAVDLPSGPMRPDVIVDKRNLDESMGGWPITQARHDNGVVFTLYRGAVHPFVHALNANEAWAVCLDLPEIGADDATAARDWGLAVSPDGATVYAVNATIGLVGAIDPAELSFRQMTSFEAPRAAATIQLAKFGHQPGGPVGRRVVVSPDGKSLFAAGSGGIVRLETSELSATGTLVRGAAVDGLALTPDGTTLFALLGDGRIVRLDAATGQLLGEVAGDDYDRLVAVVPW